MPKRTDIYNYYTLEDGDIWYPGYDQENMLTAENQNAGLFGFVGSGVTDGWDVHPMTDYRSEQIELIEAYDADPDSELGQRYRLMELEPAHTVRAATTANLASLAGSQTIDGVVVTEGDLVLVKDQDDAAENGVYQVEAGSDPWTQQLADPEDFNTNLIVRVNQGNTQAKTLWVMTPLLPEDVDPGVTEVYFDDVFKQVIRVSPGRGVVGVYPARTSKSAYFRFQRDNIYYVWAEASICLQSEGIAAITAPQEPDELYDEVKQAAYLAAVEVAIDATTDIPYVLDIDYGDRRRQLKNLQAEFERALRLAFYRHVHLGGPTNPSKIVLSTQLVLRAYAPEGSTIFQIRTESGAPFTWSANAYGIPEVRLNNVPLPETDYTIVSSSGRLFLKNSVPAGAVVQVILPLFSQKRLSVHEPSSSIGSPTIYLSENNATPPTVFTWSNEDYHPAEVYIRGQLLEADTYTISPTQGFLQLANPGAYSPALTDNGDLLVILTRLGREVEGTLSGKRVKDLDASTFTRGTLDQRRLVDLDHVGQFRYREPAQLRPATPLLSEGDHVTFYPEIDGSPLQYGTEVHAIYLSANFKTAPYLLGTKRGLLQTTSEFASATQASSWPVDRGEPSFFIDEILPAGEKTNKFKTTYALTRQGKVYSTADFGSSWQLLRNPVDDNTTPMVAAAFYASTKRDENVLPSGIVEYEWSSNLYIGTDRGFYSVNIPEGTADSDWAWAKLTRWRDSSGSLLDPDSIGTVHAVLEITTLTVVTDDEGNRQESFENTLYLGTDAGFFVGSASDVKRYATAPTADDIVRGFYWIQGGTNNNNQNDLIWWTNNAVYITHTARFNDDGEGTTSWTRPLTATYTSFSNVAAATTAEITSLATGAPNVVDGVSLSVGSRVLVKNQETDPEQNGIYVVSTVGSGSNGVWARATDADASAEFVANKQVTVSGGTVNGGSIWYLPPLADGSAYSLGATEILWKIKQFRIYYSATYQPLTAVQRTGFSDYFIGNEDGVTLVEDSFAVGGAPASTRLEWTTASQQSASALVSLNSAISDQGMLIAAGSRGFWKSTDALLAPTSFVDADLPEWVRTRDVFNAIATLTVYDQNTEEIVTGWTSSYPFQSVTFDAAPTIGRNFRVEYNYTDFYVAPWNPDNANVVVYIGDEPSDIPYGLDAEAGKITFVQSLSPAQAQQVYITILRDGAFISNVGKTKHGEMPNSFLIGDSEDTRLARELAPADVTLYVSNREAIPIDTRYLELRTATARERIIVSVNPVTRAITLPYPRASTVTFPVNASVYVVRVGSELGIEDEITRAQSNLTYHLASLDNANTIQLALAARAEFSDLFDNYYGSPKSGTLADRGPKKALLLDFENDTPLDNRATSSSLYEGLDPSRFDSSIQPRVIYAMDNVSASGSGMRVGTDQGVWIYNNDKWTRESALDNAPRVYYLSGAKIGASTGEWNRTGDEWVFNPTYPQTIFDYSAGSWGDNYTYQAWGKNDGLAFVYTKTADDTFKSDHFDPLDGRRVYGLYKNKFIRITTDSSGNSKQTEVDALYLCTEDGLFGVTFGSRGGSFAELLTGREMFGNTLRGVKFYRIFKALPTPPSTKETVPIIILSSDGIYKVRNWRWCDPADASSLNFAIENHSLAGLPCYCFAVTSAEGPPGVSKCFVGTAEGVVRSYDQGSSWERCERILGGDTIVYDLKIITSGSYTVLIAATEEGFWYSVDDGDTWYRTGEALPNNDTPVTFDARVNSYANFNTTGSNGYLAQTFRNPAGERQIVKVGAYLSLRELDEDDPQLAASQGNVLRAYIYNTNGSGVPTSQVSYSSSGTIDDLIAAGYLPAGFTTPDGLTASSVTAPGFYYLYLPVTLPDLVGDPDDVATYALVLKEEVALGGTNLFQWQLSNGEDPYAEGEAFSGGSTPSWSVYDSSTDRDFFFRVYFEASTVTEEIIEPVGFYSSSYAVGFDAGDSLGCAVTDAGALITDTKLAVALTVDDSASAVWSDPSERRDVEIGDFVSSLWERTDTTVNGDSYSVNYGDWWQFGTNITERSNGYTNDANALVNYANALRSRGTRSDLFEAANLALTGLQPQSIADSIRQADDAAGNAARVADLVTLLEDRSLLRLDAIRTWYAEQPDKQINLQVDDGSSVDVNPIQLSINGTDTFAWDSSIYPYIEVRVNDVIVSDSLYTVTPSTGRISFTPTLSSSDTLEVILRTDWDGTAEGIAGSEDVADHLVRRWTATFVPVACIFADGDNSSTAVGLDSVALTANSGWGDTGYPVYTFGLGRSHAQSDLRTLADLTAGRHFDIADGTNGQDWDTAKATFLHGGMNSLFTARWDRVYDFNDPVYIKEVNAVYTVPSSLSVPAAATVEVRYTRDRMNFTAWQSITSGVALTIQEEVLGIQYRVRLTEGWSGSAPVRPYVSQLYHVRVKPAVQYLVTAPHDVDGMMLEYILSTETTSPATSRVSWALCRGNSTDFADYERVRVNRNGALPNRQQSIQFTPEVVRTGLATTTSDNRTYQVYEENGGFATWALTDTVQIYVDNVLVAAGRGFYALDGKRGLIYFTTELPSSSRVTVTITTPSRMYTSLGEPTTTVDGRSYYLVNGRWPADSEIVVLLNGTIVRGGYFANNEIGVITFARERERTDIVTVFVKPASAFRLGVEIKNYSTSEVSIANCGLFYTTRTNLSLLERYNNTPSPTIVGSVSILPETPTIYRRMELAYDYLSVDGNVEKNTQTRWYRTRGTSEVEVTAANGLPEYTNRTVSRQADLGGAGSVFLTGDEIYAIVTPSDGISFGLEYTSLPITLLGTRQPYAFDAVVAPSQGQKTETPANSGLFYVTPNQELRAKFTFNDGDGGGNITLEGTLTTPSGATNSSVVRWYNKDSSTALHTGPVLPARFVTKSSVLSFVVTPVDETFSGTPVRSDEVTVS